MLDGVEQLVHRGPALGWIRIEAAAQDLAQPAGDTGALGLIELLIKPFEPMRKLFGMKPKRGKEEKSKTAVA